MRSLILFTLAIVLPAAATTMPSTSPKPAKAPAPAQPAASETDILITFRPDNEVKGSVVRLADIAVIESEDQDAVQQLGLLEVGSMPLTGRTGTITQGYVRIKIRSLKLDVKRFQFAGAQLCGVTRPEQILSGAEIEKAALEAVRATQQDLDVISNYTPLDQRLPLGKIETRPMTARLFGTTSGTIPVQVLVDGKQEASISVSFRLVKKAPVVVATRDIPAGTVLGTEDIEIQDRAAVAGPLQISTLDQAIGRQVTSPIKSGTTLTNSMLKSATIVKRGARIKLICRGNGFTVTAAGEALQDAANGQLVRVRNLTSRLEVTGTAVGDQLVEVPF
jgi:flagellar basal body P-ring formation protein FlgA